MLEVKIKFDFSHGPIWKEIYDVSTGSWPTGITALDRDEILEMLNDKAEAEYSSLFAFDKQGRLIFDATAFEKKKGNLSSFVRRIVQRMEMLNDGSYQVFNEEAERLDMGR